MFFPQLPVTHHAMRMRRERCAVWAALEGALFSFPGRFQQLTDRPGLGVACDASHHGTLRTRFEVTPRDLSTASPPGGRDN